MKKTCASLRKNVSKKNGKNLKSVSKGDEGGKYADATLGNADGHSYLRKIGFANEDGDEKFKCCLDDIQNSAAFVRILDLVADCFGGGGKCFLIFCLQVNLPLCYHYSNTIAHRNEKK